MKQGRRNPRLCSWRACLPRVHVVLSAAVAWSMTSRAFVLSSPSFVCGELGELARRHRLNKPPKGARVVGRASSIEQPTQAIGQWLNRTVEFWEGLELWSGIPPSDDPAAEAVALEAQFDRIDSFERQIQDGKISVGEAPAAFGEILRPLPELILAYGTMRVARVLAKPAVKRGVSSGVVYVNVAIAFAALRTIVPRLLFAQGTLDDLYGAAQAVGIPDGNTLSSALDALQSFDAIPKLGLFTLAFVIEKLFFIQEFFPLQIILKTLSPLLFGGLLPGALISAGCETVAASCSFAIGRAFLTTRLREFRFWGSGQPIGEQRWFESVQRTAGEDSLQLTLLLRLAPVIPVPLDAYWYILGALPVALPEFVLGHYLGCLKTSFLDASFGALLLSAVAPEGALVESQAREVLLVEAVGLVVVGALVGTVATQLVNRLLGLDETMEGAQAEPQHMSRPGSTGT